MSVKLDTIDINHSIDASPDPKQFRMHTHRRYELYFFVSGTASFYVEGRNYPLKRGDIMVINSTESHCIAVAENTPYERYVIHFERDAITGIDPSGELLSVFEKRGLGECVEQGPSTHRTHNRRNTLREDKESVGESSR
jgi:hypothetical protein